MTTSPSCAKLKMVNHFYGYAFADIRLSNPSKLDLQPMEVRALAGTGALMLCIREVTTADERRTKVPYVGPVRVAFDGRSGFVGALVLGDEVLMGAVPMEDMDLVISPAKREVTVDPENPNLPHARVKAAETR